MPAGIKMIMWLKKIGLTAQNFAVKKQRGNWSPEELEKIINVSTKPNEEAEDALMLEIMRSRKDDETLTYDEYKAEISTWK
jgi:hypothetical protein